MYCSSKVGGFLKMRYRGVRPEREREKNKTKVYSLIKKYHGSTLSELIDRAKPLAKDTVVSCVRELVADSKSTNNLLAKIMLKGWNDGDGKELTMHLDSIINDNKKNVIEFKLGNRKIYSSLSYKKPLASVAQSMMLSMHRLITDDITRMESYDLSLEDKIENAKTTLDTVCDVLWELITSDMENPTKIRFTKEMRECRERIKTIFDIARRDPDAGKILPYLYPRMVRKPNFTEDLTWNPDKLTSLPISPSIIEMYMIIMKDLNSEHSQDSP